MTKTNLQIRLVLREIVTFRASANAFVRMLFRIFRAFAGGTSGLRTLAVPHGAIGLLGRYTQFPADRDGSAGAGTGPAAPCAGGVAGAAPGVAAGSAPGTRTGGGVVSFVSPCVSSSFESSQIPGLFVCKTTETTSRPSFVAALTRTCCAGRV